MDEIPRRLKPAILTVDQARINLYAEMTGDYNPIHVDPEFAARGEMGGVIAHGTLSLNLIWQALESTLGKDALDTIEIDVRFRRPVRLGDHVEAGGEWNEDLRGYSVWVRNQSGENVIEGSAALAG